MHDQFRPDGKEYSRLFIQLGFYKWVVLVQAGLIAVLVVTLVAQVQRGVQIVAVSPQGQAAWTAGVDETVYKNMAVNEVRDFVECMSTVDQYEAPTLRRKAEWYMVPSLALGLRKTISDSITIKNLIDRGLRSQIEWDVPVRVIDWKFPAFKAYGNFHLTVQDKDGHITRESHHLAVMGSFLGSTPSRPSGLYVTNFQYLTDTKSINDILNKLGG